MNIGRFGEQLAREFMEGKGYSFLRNNYRYERAETDLIFEDKEKRTLVFVEVKTRRSKLFGEPEDAVTFAKQEQLVKSAEGFVMENPEYETYEMRFDVVSIFMHAGQREINHIESIF